MNPLLKRIAKYRKEMSVLISPFSSVYDLMIFATLYIMILYTVDLKQKCKREISHSSSNGLAKEKQVG